MISNSTSSGGIGDGSFDPDILILIASVKVQHRLSSPGDMAYLDCFAYLEYVNLT